MVFTRSQTENMCREKLVEELLNLLDVSTKLANLTNKFDEFVSKNDKLHSELQLTRNCYSHILRRIVQLERNVTKSQYHIRKRFS